MLKNDYLVVKIGVDTAENEPFKSPEASEPNISPSAQRKPSVACGGPHDRLRALARSSTAARSTAGGHFVRTARGDVGLAMQYTYPLSDGPCSAVSPPIIAT